MLPRSSPPPTEQWLKLNQAVALLRNAGVDDPQTQLRQNFRLGKIRGRADILTNSAQELRHCELPPIFWRNGMQHEIDWGASQINAGQSSTESTVYYAEAYGVTLNGDDLESVLPAGSCHQKRKPGDLASRIEDHEIKAWLEQNKEFVEAAGDVDRDVVPRIREQFPTGERNRDDIRSLIREFKTTNSIEIKKGPKRQMQLR